MVDFNNLEKGSDLWLFYQINDFGESWKKIHVVLTPGFDGRVWYTKNPAKKALTIHRSSANEANAGAPAQPSRIGNQEVSYRMTVNRYDWEKWPAIIDVNISDKDVLKEK